MKKAIIITALSFTLLFTIGCSDESSSQELDEVEVVETEESSEDEADEAGENEESTEASEPEEELLSESDAVALSEAFFLELVETAGDDNYEHFRTLYADSMEEEVVQQDFDFFKAKNEEGLRENLDIGILFVIEDVIAASIFEYTNINAENRRNHTATEAKLYMELFEDGWKFSTSEKVQNAYNDSFIPLLNDKYGEDYVAEGFVSGNHAIIFERVFTNDIDVQIYRVKRNDDGAFSIDIAISNGLDNDVFDVRFNELTFNYGFEQIPFLTLENYELDTNHIIYSKDMSIVTVEYDASDLLVPADQVDFSRLGIEQSMKYTNRD
ncbi:hypothetical protein [Evansella cellulosilytica]|uniref:Uncharacterized protein n=1 Tax=Evansella cellulosilytica (strain ATCC 21833 / DSM 2522 / FERM P-1141 / JCM 9156 / N-4) TaxID=649639 RepID=E6TTY2_EVAC2|nr:hypothetical protein [Evansella cellulosilytica]ADU32013.1 hypothetical protein Bcell_3773 [Evansella cellulosilytica DSM 2522]